MDYEKLRESFEPTKVRVLFVGESPPPKGFFYCCNSNLYRATLATFENVFGNRCRQGTDFLEIFKEMGCYLEDLCAKPIKGMSAEVKEREKRKGIKRLTNKIVDDKPKAIICVMYGINCYVTKAHLDSGVDALYLSIPFPARRKSNKECYVSNLSTFLRNLIKKGIISLRK